MHHCIHGVLTQRCAAAVHAQAVAQSREGGLHIAVIDLVHARQGRKHGAVLHASIQGGRGEGCIGCAVGIHGGDHVGAGQVGQAKNTGHSRVGLVHRGRADRTCRIVGACKNSPRFAGGQSGQCIDIQGDRAPSRHANSHQVGVQVFGQSGGLIPEIVAQAAVLQLCNDHACVASNIDAEGA